MRWSLNGSHAVRWTNSRISPIATSIGPLSFRRATHLIGTAEYWVLELAGERDVQRDRLAEFRATGTGAALAARYERWLAAMQDLLQTLPDEQLDQLVPVEPGYHPSLDETLMTLREALLHAIEHCALSPMVASSEVVRRETVLPKRQQCRHLPHEQSTEVDAY
jgi:Protein of unknown function (DUF664)